MAIGTETYLGLGGFTQATFNADGAPMYKIGGVTLDPGASIPVGGTGAVTLPSGAPGTGTALAGGQVIPTGVAYLPFGAVLVKNSGNDYSVPWDGVTTLIRGQTVVIDNTLTALDNGYGNPMCALQGGRVYIKRAKILSGGVWTTASSANQAALLAAEPLFEPVYY